MANRGDPKVLRLVVIFLRSYTGMTQAQFGTASRVDQADVSRFELGHRAPSEEVLRRMAEVAEIDWPLVASLRQFYASFLPAALMRRDSGGPIPQAIDLRLLESVVVQALTPYLLESEEASKQALRSREEERREAEQIWAALEVHPIHYRRRLIELSPRSGSWALALRVCEASVTSAAGRRPGEALELADLALSIAERFSGEQSSRSRLLGYCWAHVGNARQLSKDLGGAEKAFALARQFGRGEAKSVSNGDGIILPSKEELLDQSRAAQRQVQMGAGSRRGRRAETDAEHLSPEQDGERSSL